MHLTTAVSRYLEERGPGLSKHTLRAYRSDLLHLSTSCRAQTVRRAITQAGVTRFLQKQQEAGYAPRTLRRRLACIRHFTRWLSRSGHISHDPCRDLDVRIPVPIQLARNLSLGDASRLRGTAERLARKLAPLFLRSGPASRPSLSLKAHAAINALLATDLLLATGIRVGELTSIAPPDIDLDAGVITIHGKGNRERRVHLCDQQARQRLRRYLHSTVRQGRGNLLVRHDGRPLTPDDVRSLVRTTAARAGLSCRVTPHMLRHTTATLLLEHGLDIRHVQALLGHASITTTQRYTHVADNSLRSALQRVQARYSLQN